MSDISIGGGSTAKPSFADWDAYPKNIDGTSVPAEGLMQAATTSMRGVVDALSRENLDDLLNASSKVSDPDAPSLRSPHRLFSANDLSGGVLALVLGAALWESTFEAGEKKMRINLDIYRENRDKQVANFQQNEKDIEASAKSAKEASDKMGCAAKVLGGILTGIGVLAAIFTGGASLVLAGIGLAMLAADLIVGAITGQSITGRIISPLIDNVFLPLVKKIGDAVASMLEKMGVPADIAGIVGTAVGFVVAAVGVIVLIVASKSLAGKAMSILGKVLSKVGSAIEKKLAKTAFSGFAKAGSNALSSVKGSVSSATAFMKKPLIADGEAIGAHLRTGEAVIAIADGGTQAGFGIYVGAKEQEVQNALAKQIEIAFGLEGTKGLLDRAVESWQETMRTVQAQLERTGQDLQNDMAANSWTLSQMHV